MARIVIQLILMAAIPALQMVLRSVMRGHLFLNRQAVMRR